MNGERREQNRAGTQLESVQKVWEGGVRFGGALKRLWSERGGEAGGVYIRVLSHQAVGLLSIGCLPPRLSVVLLPCSVDVVEQRHGERHAQELWRRRGEADSEFVSPCICVFMRDICVSFWCWRLQLQPGFLMHCKSCGEAQAHFRSLPFSSDGLQTRALESLWWEKSVQPACTSIKSMK